MSFNDRCGEAGEVLAHGGVLPPEAWPALIDLLLDAKDTCRAPRELVYAILNHPDNAALVAQTSDGEWVGA